MFCPSFRQSLSLDLCRPESCAPSGIAPSPDGGVNVPFIRPTVGDALADYTSNSRRVDLSPATLLMVTAVGFTTIDQGDIVRERQYIIGRISTCHPPPRLSLPACILRIALWRLMIGVDISEPNTPPLVRCVTTGQAFTVSACRRGLPLTASSFNFSRCQPCPARLPRRRRTGVTVPRAA